MLSYAGSGDKDAKVTAAIASSIWAAYEKNGKIAFHNDELKMVFMDCEVSIYIQWQSLKPSATAELAKGSHGFP